MSTFQRSPIYSMLTTRSFWLKFFEALCLLVVLIGVTQMVEAVSRWQFEIVNDWAKSLPILAGMLAVSFIVSFFWERSKKGAQLHRIFQTIIAFYVAHPTDWCFCAVARYGQYRFD